MMFNSAKVVRCVKYTNFGDKPAIEVRVQAFNNINEVWENAYIKKDLDLTTGAIHTVPLATCVDSPLKMEINNGKRLACAWVSKQRCAKPGVSSHCPATCGTGCSDSKKRFIHPNGKAKRCGWIAKKNTKNRCSKAGIAETCRVTCASHAMINVFTAN